MDCPCCKKAILLWEEAAITVHESCLKKLLKPKDEAKEEAQYVRESDVRAFLKCFCEEYTARRNGATYHPRRPKDLILIRLLLGTYSLERLKKLAIMLLETDEEWVDMTDRGIGVLSVKASWLDSKLAAYESRRSA